MKPTSESRPRQPIPKPAKPHPDFPLFPHLTKRWAKKVRGKLHYFGRWDDPQGALERWLAVKDDLLAGRRPRPPGGGLTIRDLVNRFLTAKQNLVDAGELAPSTFRDYYRCCAVLVKVLDANRLASDLRPEDFEGLRAHLAKTNGPARLGSEVQRVRTLFRYADESGLLETPVKFGPTFRGPPQRVMRKLKAARGPKMFSPTELLAMLDAAGQPLRTMILLGVNCGFGNQDAGTLPLGALDLEGGWITYARPKTGIPRRCPLWQETVMALREWLTVRPEPKAKAHAGLVFLTRHRDSWASRSTSSPIGKEFCKLVERLGLPDKYGFGFYSLRHVFRTIADEVLDQPAADLIMGHVSHGMAAAYRERIGDDRLRRVTDHVRRWLFGATVDEGRGEDEARILRIG